MARKPRSRAKPHHQLTFRRVPILGVARKYGFPDPPDRELAGSLDRLVVDHGRRHGWSDGVIRKARVGRRVLLGMRDTDRVPVLATDAERLVPLGLPARSVRAVLDEAGLLDDDRTPALERWFDRQLVGLPATMAGEMRVWFDMLRNGSTSAPRRKPRSPGTIRPTSTGRCLLFAPGLKTATGRCERSPETTCSSGCPPGARPGPLSATG